MSHSLIHSEYRFTKQVSEKIEVSLTLHINYENQTYDFMQDSEEGILISNNNSNIEVNKAYLELGLEILEFVNLQLFSIGDKKQSSKYIN